MIFAVIIPAVAFVVVAYVGFWVDRDAAPARFVPPVLLLSFPSIVLPVCLLSPLTSFASKQGNFRALSLTALPYWLVSSILWWCYTLVVLHPGGAFAWCNRLYRLVHRRRGSVLFLRLLDQYVSTGCVPLRTVESTDHQGTLRWQDTCGQRTRR